MGFGELCFPFGGQMQGLKRHFGPRSGPSWRSCAPLRCLEATAMLLGAKSWRGSWGQVGPSGGHVEAKLGSSAMLLVLMLSPSRTKILSGFLRAMFAPFGVKYKATLWLRWCHLGANFGNVGAVSRSIWDHFRPWYLGIFKNNPKLYLQNALPSGPRGVTE